MTPPDGDAAAVERRAATVQADQPDGLPEPLPPGEAVLWQGSPRWTAMAWGGFRIGYVAAYFVLLALWRAGSDLADGAPLAEGLTTALWFLPLAGGAIGLLALLAWLTCRAAVYTITTRRVVLQVGVALPVTMNLPFARISAAAHRAHARGTGDLPLTLLPGDRAPYWALWPHVRPWRWAHPEPMLRAVPDSEKVAGILAGALAAAGTGVAQGMAPAAPGPMSVRPRADATV